MPRVLLLLTIAMVIWSVSVTLLGYFGVMAQPFIVPKDTPVFWGPFPTRGIEPADVEVLVEAPSRPDFEGDGCKIKYRWPHRLTTDEGDTNPFDDNGERGFGLPPNTDRGWPSVEDMFYADGFEKQLRVVRNDMVGKWRTMVLSELSAAELADPSKKEIRDCAGEKGVEWNMRYKAAYLDWSRDGTGSAEADKKIRETALKDWSQQVAGVGDTASKELSKLVRDRFEKIIFAATIAFFVWAIAVPLGIILLTLSWFSIFPPGGSGG